MGYTVHLELLTQLRFYQATSQRLCRRTGPQMRDIVLQSVACTSVRERENALQVLCCEDGWGAASDAIHFLGKVSRHGRLEEPDAKVFPGGFQWLGQCFVAFACVLHPCTRT